MTGGSLAVGSPELAITLREIAAEVRGLRADLAARKDDDV